MQHVSDKDYAAYLRRVGEDYADSGSEATAEDYAEAARRIDPDTRTPDPTPAIRVWERITAQEIQHGDFIAKTRNEVPARVDFIESAGASSRYIRMEDGSRIRPRHTAKFWRGHVSV